MLHNAKDSELRARAARVVPGGMWGHQNAANLPEGYPQFFSGAQGCRIRDVDGKQKLTLPGWESFSKQFGTDKPARELFVEMIRDEGPLVEAIQTNDAKIITEKLRGSIGKLTQRMQTGVFQKTPPAIPPCASRSRPASSTSAATRRPATSAPLRFYSL